MRKHSTPRLMIPAVYRSPDTSECLVWVTLNTLALALLPGPGRVFSYKSICNARIGLLTAEVPARPRDAADMHPEARAQRKN